MNQQQADAFVELVEDLIDNKIGAAESGDLLGEFRKDCMKLKDQMVQVLTRESKDGQG